MTNSAHTYAVVFLESVGKLSGTDQGEAVERFVSIVHRQGWGRRLSQIVEEIERLVVKKAGGKYVELSIASGSSEGLLKELRSHFTNKDKVITKVDPSLIAGVRVTVDGEKELDWSMRRRLDSLFSNNY